MPGRGVRRVPLPGIIAGLFILASLWVPAGMADPIQLKPAEYILANGTPLDPGLHAIPCVADWNGDGLADLIVGYRNDDQVAFYANVGDWQHPAFAGFVPLQAGGSNIVHASLGCGAPSPWVCDYDSDGNRDLLVGTGQEGYVYFYRNIHTDAAPILTNKSQLLLQGSVLTVPLRATPYVCDWDEDGREDLLCGDGNGQVHFFRNVGTANAPVYTADTLLQAGGTTLSLGFRSAVRVCDWDGDGVKDLLGSGSYNASWCRNTGGHAAPQLSAPQPLQAPAAGLGLVPIDTGYRMRLEVVDWNQDQVLDLLIGDNDGFIFYYQGYRFAINGVAAQSNGSMVLQWNSASHLRYNVLAGPAPDQIDGLVATGLSSAGDGTTWTNASPAPAEFYRIQIAP